MSIRKTEVFVKTSNEDYLIRPNIGFHQIYLNEGFLEVIDSSGRKNGLPVSDVSDVTIRAEVGKTLPIDCTSSTVSVQPPINPKKGDYFSVVDAYSNAGARNITISFISEGQKFFGASANHVMNTNKAFVNFIYIDNAIGWVFR